MDAISENIVAGDVADGFDGDGFAVEFYLIGLHGLLNRGTDVGDTHVDSGFLVPNLV